MDVRTIQSSKLCRRDCNVIKKINIHGARQLHLQATSLHTSLACWFLHLDEELPTVSYKGGDRVEHRCFMASISMKSYVKYCTRETIVSSTGAI